MSKMFACVVETYEDDINIHPVCFEGTDDKEENRKLCLLKFIGGVAERYHQLKDSVDEVKCRIAIQGEGYEDDIFYLVTRDYYERANDFTKGFGLGVIDDYLDSNDYPDPDAE